MARTRTLKKQPPLAAAYLSLFDRMAPVAIEMAPKWRHHSPPIHRPVRNLLGLFIPEFNGNRLVDIAKSQFSPSGKTRNTDTGNPKRSPTFWFEIGLAPQMKTCQIGTTLLQQSFSSAGTYTAIGELTELSTTLMIVIHAFNTNIVPDEEDTLIAEHHTAIAACTFHLFPKESPRVCFVSYLAVTQQLYNQRTVTGFGIDNEPPFRGNEYGFARLLLRIASLTSGSQFDDSVADSGCRFLPVFLQTQKDSVSRSYFLRLGCAPLSIEGNPDLKLMNELPANDQKMFNYQPATTSDIVTLGILGKHYYSYFSLSLKLSLEFSLPYSNIL